MVKGLKLSDYGFVRVGVVTPELRIADVEFNTNVIIKTIKDAGRHGCFLICYPELSVTGYTCGDLFFQEELLDEVLNSLVKISDATINTKTTIIVGAPLSIQGKLFNCGIFISSGKILGVVPKTYLCNSNEYYEERWFSSSYDRICDEVEIGGMKVVFGSDLLFRCSNFKDLIVGIEICEDLWAVVPPSFEQTIRGATVLFNLSASNEYLGKAEYRRELIKSQSARCLAAYCYSAAGPNESTTDVIYSGNSMIAENGYILSETPKYALTTQIAYSDIDIQRIISERQKNNSYGFTRVDNGWRVIEFRLNESEVIHIERTFNSLPFVPTDVIKRRQTCEEIFALQSVGLAKRINHLGIEKVVIGISGGLDSTLALLVAIEAFERLRLKNRGIIAVVMPGSGSTDRTQMNAERLARQLNVTLKVIKIDVAVKNHLKDIGHKEGELDVTFENAQARERTQILMDIANENRAIVIGTGDLSEIALGWNTFSGDHISMYNVNAGVPKTLVKYIIQWCSEERYKGKISEVLKDIIETPISPELLPPDSKGKIKQKTEEIIGPFELHDFYLYYFIRFGFSPRKIQLLAELSFESKYSKVEIRKWLNVFIKRFFTNQFKRNCIPDGPKIGTVALSPRGDWRMPSDAESQLWLK